MSVITGTVTRSCIVGIFIGAEIAVRALGVVNCPKSATVSAEGN